MTSCIPILRECILYLLNNLFFSDLFINFIIFCIQPFIKPINSNSKVLPRRGLIIYMWGEGGLRFYELLLQSNILQFILFLLKNLPVSLVNGLI